MLSENAKDDMRYLTAMMKDYQDTQTLLLHYAKEKGFESYRAKWRQRFLIEDSHSDLTIAIKELIMLLSSQTPHDNRETERE